jgi:hypothetical protein
MDVSRGRCGFKLNWGARSNAGRRTSLKIGYSIRIRFHKYFLASSKVFCLVLLARLVYPRKLPIMLLYFLLLISRKILEECLTNQAAGYPLFQLSLNGVPSLDCLRTSMVKLLPYLAHYFVRIMEDFAISSKHKWINNVLRYLQAHAIYYNSTL